MLVKYRKSIVAAIGTLVAWGLSATTDGHVTIAEWWGLVAVVGTVLGVWGIPNDMPPGEPLDPNLSVRE